MRVTRARAAPTVAAAITRGRHEKFENIPGVAPLSKMPVWIQIRDECNYWRRQLLTLRLASHAVAIGIGWGVRLLLAPVWLTLWTVEQIANAIAANKSRRELQIVKQDAAKAKQKRRWHAPTA